VKSGQGHILNPFAGSPNRACKYSLGWCNVAYDIKVTVTYFSHLIPHRRKCCPGHILNVVLCRITKPCMQVQVSVVECHVTYSGHCDLPFTLRSASKENLVLMLLIVCIYVNVIASVVQTCQGLRRIAHI